MCRLDRRVRRAQPRPELLGRQRRPLVLRRRTYAGCTHQIVNTGSGPKAARTPAFKWVNTALGNIKAAITGTYRAINSKHIPRYLAEFEYRFNRHYDLAAIIPRLTWAAVRTTPMPYRLLKLVEVCA
jgi:ISXO2-like transposase domain